MTYRIKDSNKNLIVEHETFEQFDAYISESKSENSELQFFEYDSDIYHRIQSGSLEEGFDSENIRIRYQPSQDDIED
jgi:hypothetical protein